MRNDEKGKSKEKITQNSTISNEYEIKSNAGVVVSIICLHISVLEFSCSFCGILSAPQCIAWPAQAQAQCRPKIFVACIHQALIANPILRVHSS